MKRQSLLPGQRRKAVVGTPSPSRRTRRQRETGRPEKPAAGDEPRFCGDPERDALTLESCRPGLKGWVRREFPNLYDCDLDEVVHRAVVKAFAARSTYDPARGAKLFTWLCTIARNTALDQIRKRKRERARLVPIESCSELEYDLPAQESPAERCEGRRIRAKLDRIIADLPEPQRFIIILFWYRERPSLAGIGRELGLPVRKVREEFREAMNTIGVALRRRYYGPPA